MSTEQRAESDPRCNDCGHLVAVHSHESGCMDSMTGGLLERDRLGFCPCVTTSVTLVRELVASLTGAGESYDALVDACHVERRQAWDADRGQEAMTLEQHWSATAGWLRWREREKARTGEPDWSDAMNSAEPRNPTGSEVTS